MRGVELLRFLTFASDAEIAGVWGLGFVLLAVIAGFAEHRRTKRARIESVGWVPWFGISLPRLIVGAGLIALSVKGIAAG